MLAELENEFTIDSITFYFHLLTTLDIQRLEHNLLESESDTKALYTRSDKRSIAKDVIAIHEILSYRRLYSDARIVKLLSKVCGAPRERNDPYVSMGVVACQCH